MSKETNHRSDNVNPSASTESLRPRTPHRLILLAFLAFISLGLPDTLMGVTWPSIRARFGLPISHIGFILISGTCGYLLSSFFAGAIVTRLGVGRLLAASCAIVTVSLSIYAFSPFWPALMLAAVLGGLGAGAIDAGVNTFAATAFSSRVLNWMHGCWGIGASCGPLIMTAVLAAHHTYSLGYAIVAGTIFVLTLVFFRFRNAWQLDVPAANESHAESATLSQALSQPIVLGQVLFYFLYGGVESSAGTWLYTLLTESRGIAIAAAGATVGLYWASITGGRMIFGQVAHHLRAEAVLRIGLIGAIGGAVLMHGSFPLPATFAGAVLLGLMLAPLFPTLIALTPARVGTRFAAHAVGMQVSACALGIAVIPGTIGWLARRWGIEILPASLMIGTAMLLAIHNALERLSKPSSVSAG